MTQLEKDELFNQIVKVHKGELPSDTLNQYVKEQVAIEVISFEEERMLADAQIEQIDHLKEIEDIDEVIVKFGKYLRQ